MIPQLTHFTNSIDAVLNILSHGFAWQRNDRDVISVLLPDLDFSKREPQSFGQLCLTENRIETDRNETKFFGQFGIQVSTNWAIANNAQPVIYLPESGPLVDSFRSLFTQTYQKAIAEQKYPDDEAMQQWVVSAAMAGLDGQPLYASLLHIYEFMEPAKHSKEREWRVVNPLPDWSISNSTEEAIKNVSPPKGWAKHIHVVDVEPRDVDAIICPRSIKTELEDRLPEQFRGIEVHAH